MQVEVMLEDMDIGMVMLGLAELSLSRPGFKNAIDRIVDAFELARTGSRADYEGLRESNADRVKMSHGPLWSRTPDDSGPEAA